MNKASIQINDHITYEKLYLLKITYPNKKKTKKNDFIMFIALWFYMILNTKYLIYEYLDRLCCYECVECVVLFCMYEKIERVRASWTEHKPQNSAIKIIYIYIYIYACVIHWNGKNQKEKLELDMVTI